MALKLSKSELVKSFSGGEGINEWLAKAELVAKLTGVKDEAHFLPLLLEGGAMAVFMEMPEDEQKCAEKDKEKTKRGLY